LEVLTVTSMMFMKAMKIYRKYLTSLVQG